MRNLRSQHRGNAGQTAAAFDGERQEPVWEAPCPNMAWPKEMTSTSARLDAEDVRLELDRVLKSRDFEATERTRKFLAFVVDQTLSNRADRIKAYSIATEVFGRDASFDPHSDPIVRIEAGHLRRALERYFLTAGKDDPIVITIPKGGYVPVFDRRHDKAPIAPAVVVQRLRDGFGSWLRQSCLCRSGAPSGVSRAARPNCKGPRRTCRGFLSTRSTTSRRPPDRPRSPRG